MSKGFPVRQPDMKPHVCESWLTQSRKGRNPRVFANFGVNAWFGSSTKDSSDCNFLLCLKHESTVVIIGKRSCNSRTRDRSCGYPRVGEIRFSMGKMRHSLFYLLILWCSIHWMISTAHIGWQPFSLSTDSNANLFQYTLHTHPEIIFDQLYLSIS